MPIDFHHMTGIPWEVEQNLQKLRSELEMTQQVNADLMARIQRLPPILSIEQIRQALGPMGGSALATAGLLNTVPAPTNPVPPPATPVADGIPSHISEVNAVYAVTPVGPASTDAEMFDFCRAVAAAILASNTDPPGLTCGLLLKAGGANVYVYNGDSYSFSRVCYNNGHVFKIVVDADPGGARTPTWDDNSPPLLPQNYHVLV